MRERLLLAALALGLAGCGEAGREPEAGVLGDTIRPPVRPALGHVRLGPRLRPVAIAGLGEGRYVAADLLEPVLWELRPGPQPPPPRRLRRMAPRSWIVGLDAGPEGLGVLLRDGALILWSPDGPAPSPVAATPRMPGESLGLAALPDGRWAELRVEGSASARGGLVAVLAARETGGSEEEALWRGALDGPWMPALDMPSLSAAGDTLVLTGAAPPRLLRLTAADRVARVQSLEGAPRRPLPAAFREEIERELARLPAAWSPPPPPRHLPTVLKARRYPGGTLVAAAVGPHAVGVEQYCGARYRRTAVALPDVRDVHFLREAVVLLREEPTAGGASLDFFLPAQLLGACEASTDG